VEVKGDGVAEPFVFPRPLIQRSGHYRSIREPFRFEHVQDTAITNASDPEPVAIGHRAGSCIVRVCEYLHLPKTKVRKRHVARQRDGA
jgi:hypothetical protein